MTDPLRADAEVRREAVDPGGSFIVQAPAGSGKTSLLAQRFLRLLAVVEQPEEIVAVTFTRKAAAEMRHRIVAALAAAADERPAADSVHARHVQQLARAALANGRERGWDLARHPSRLHIQTIDGLNHWLARRLPISARLGLAPELVDDARPAYVEAARDIGSLLESGDPLADRLAELVRLLDYDPARLEVLLADMLASRELWLPKLFELAEAEDLRAEMEGLLAASVEAALLRLRDRADGPLLGRLLETLREAAAAIGPESPLWPLRGARTLPAAEVAARAEWERLVASLLTKQGLPRRRLDARNGFPPGIRSLRDRMLELLAGLAEDPELVAGLHAVRLLPPHRYTDEQWRRVEVLMQVLVPAAAALQQTFARRNQCDHPAVAAAARQALGAEQAPSDLALALEYRIRHVLVDEYQDTSPVQHSLLGRLVAGWQPGDGHTLFCVGDPMQSIYGFREADVTLFLEARARGIGGVPLAARSLACNFRSCSALVDWVNRALPQVLPAAEDYERGAVPHVPSVGTRPDERGSGARVHALLDADAEEEAERVAEVAAEALADARRLEEAGPAPSERRSVAILVRNRAVLPPILAALRARGLDYRGVELEPLAARAAVRDILALARALLHPGDRVAWLAVLRAPWCGLTLADLHALAAPDHDALVAERLADRGVMASLSDDGRGRCDRVWPLLAAGLRDRGRWPLGSWVRSVWMALGGPATLPDPSDLDNANACFAALDAAAAAAGGLPTAEGLEAAVAGLMASPVGSAEARLQVMTIHKAKGLEFDTVVVPCMGRRTRSPEPQLLYWAGVAAGAGQRGLVLAGHGDGQGDALQQWMKRLEGERRELELGRLAYVAVTRARRVLHLLGSVRLDRRGEQPSLGTPQRNSLLGLLWPAVRSEYQTALDAALATGSVVGLRDAAPAVRGGPPLRRLPSAFRLPSATGCAPTTARRARRFGETVRPHFDWAGVEAVAVGTVVHAELQRVARSGCPPAQARMAPACWRDSLSRLGLPEDRLDGAVARVSRAMAQVAASPMAARLLDPAQREAASELALTATLDGQLVSVRIDRTFVDDQGVRWIVDWKTSVHEGGALDEFIGRELERYGDQLARYAEVVRLLDGRPQRVGLYFPLQDIWREWHAPDAH